MALTGHRWVQKPPPGVLIDWGNPLAQGLGMCFLFNEGGGLPADISRKGFSAQTEMGSYSWSSSGIRLTSDYPGTPLRFTAPAKLNTVQAAESFLFRGVLETALTGEAFLCGSGTASVIRLDSSRRPFYRWYDSNSKNTTAANAPALTLKRAFTVVAVRDTAGGSLFVDGTRVEAPTAASGSVTLSNTYYCLLGDASGYLKNPAEIHAFQWWNRALSDSEAVQISANPWQILQPVRRVFAVSAGSSLDGTLSATLDDAVLSATADPAINCTASVTLDSATISATGGPGVDATASVTLDDASVYAYSGLAIDFTLSATLEDVSFVGVAGGAIMGQVFSTLDDCGLSARIRGDGRWETQYPDPATWTSAGSPPANPWATQ